MHSIKNKINKMNRNYWF